MAKLWVTKLSYYDLRSEEKLFSLVLMEQNLLPLSNMRPNAKKDSKIINRYIAKPIGCSTAIAYFQYSTNGWECYTRGSQ